MQKWFQRKVDERFIDFGSKSFVRSGSGATCGGPTLFLVLVYTVARVCVLTVNASLALSPSLSLSLSLSLPLSLVLVYTASNAKVSWPECVY